MQPTRRLARRRGPHAPRLVTTRPRRHAFDGDVRAGWSAGLYALHACATLFPAFYTTHVATRPITPATLHGVAAAFLSLVEQHLPCYESEFLPLGLGDPCAALESTSTDPLGDLVEGSYYLYAPQFVLWGIGVSDIVDGERVPELLTLLLWHLLSRTRLGLGINLERLLQRHPHGALVADLDPLPAALEMDSLLARLQPATSRPRPSLATLLLYSVRETDNEMANISAYELATMYGGETDGTWGHFWELVAQANEARAIARRYYRLARWLERNPAQRLLRLVAVLYEAAGMEVAYAAP